jgi:hypothetical protein
MQRMVKYTISGEQSYSILTDDELATLRSFAAKNSELVITSVKTYRRKSVR